MARVGWSTGLRHASCVDSVRWSFDRAPGWTIISASSVCMTVRCLQGKAPCRAVVGSLPTTEECPRLWSCCSLARWHQDVDRSVRSKQVDVGNGRREKGEVRRENRRWPGQALLVRQQPLYVLVLYRTVLYCTVLTHPASNILGSGSIPRDCYFSSFVREQVGGWRGEGGVTIARRSCTGDRCRSLFAGPSRRGSCTSHSTGTRLAPPPAVVARGLQT